MIVVVGSNGQLGSELVKAAERLTLACTPLTHADVDIECTASVDGVLGSCWQPSGPMTVINTAAFHNVDACERDAQLAFEVNAIGSLNVASWCREHQAKYVYVSSEFVDATPTDPSGYPLSVYAKTKMAGELAALSLCPDGLVVRLGGLYGVAGCSGKPGRGNFIDTVVAKIKSGEKFTLPDYTKCFFTSARHAATRILQNLDKSGVWYATDGVRMSHYQIGCRLCEMLGLPNHIMAVSHDPDDNIRPRESNLGEQNFQYRLDTFSIDSVVPPLYEYLVEKGHIGG